MIHFRGSFGRLWSALATVALLLFAQPAWAQPQAQERAPTDGVDRTYHDYSSEGDASSLELNPAMLSAVDGLDMTLLGYGALSDFTRGSGFGAFLAANFGFGVALGLGIQTVMPQLGGVFDADAALNPDITKISFGLSTGDRDYGSLGIGVHGLLSNGEWLRRPDLDVGTMFRVFNYGTVGLTARLSPALLDQDGGLPGRLTMIGEVGLRPLGNHNLELAGGLKAILYETEASGGLDPVGSRGLLPHARLALRYQGWALKGEAEQVQVAQLDPAAGYDVFAREKAWRGSVGVEAAWDFVGVGTGVHAGISDGVDGIGFKARLTTARQGRAYWARPVDVDRLQLANVTDERSLIAMLQRIERAERAGDRAVLLLDVRGVEAGWASLHELRRALIRVRNAGGHVFAYMENASIQDYYLGSVAEHIYIHPAGELQTYGLTSSTLYFAKALEKIGVNVEALHIDEYKSAHEPWTRTGPSEADARQRQELLGDTYAKITHDVAQARETSINDVKRLFNDAPIGAEEAAKAGLVDAIVFRDEVTEKLSEMIGAPVNYAHFPPLTPDDRTWSETPYIAVVLVEGSIIDGESRTIPFLDIKFTGADTIARTLERLRNQPACRGIVLRVNSPGGSALASDVIWREVKLTHEANQRDPRFSPPIVVSMGDVAASGGYYVSVGTDTILADPLTVTGSIGVVSLHFDISGLLDTLGISRATFKEGKNPDINSIFSPYTPDERQRMQRSMERIYELFLERVSKGRDMTKAKVNELGRGHVYSGTDAKDIGLVDRMGGLHEAVASIRERAKVGDWRNLELRVLPEEPTLLDLILNVIGNPTDGRGPIVSRIRQARKQRAELPLALNEALARLPLSLLFLPQDQATTIMPGVVVIE